MFCLEIYLELLEGIQNGPPSVSPRRLTRGSLLPSISSRVENIFTSPTRTDIQSVAPPCLRQLKPPWANMQISQAHTGGPVREQDKEPCNCLLNWIMHAIQGHRGNNYPPCDKPRPLILSFCYILKVLLWCRNSGVCGPRILTCLQTKEKRMKWKGCVYKRKIQFNTHFICKRNVFKKFVFKLKLLKH